jgi:hypothetical protein
MEENKMNMKKVISCAAAAALAASMMSISTSAADWSTTGYADDDPTTVTIVSTDANGVTFTQQVAGGSCKARITLSDILANVDDVSKVKSGTWKVTYNGLSALTGTDVGWLGGGCWAATCNSAGFGLSPNDYAEDETTIWEDTQTVEDSFKYLLPSQVPEDATAAEFVFMDWSGQDLTAYGITLTVSDLHLYDEDGNEIAQKDYAGAATAEVADTSADTTDTAVAEAAPAADTAATTSTSTGNVAVASIASVMAVAAAAAVATKKRK